MCLYIAIIATILPVKLWGVNSALLLKYNGCELVSWLAGHSEKDSVHWRGGPSM